MVLSGGNGRRSAWREERPLTPTLSPSGEREIYAMEVSLQEQQLLLRLRMLEAGEWQVAVVKSERGMVGLREWRVIE